VKTIHLEPALVPVNLRGAYKGKKFKAQVTEQVTIPADAGLWSGGSRDLYTLINFESGVQIEMPNQQAAPWSHTRRDQTIDLKPGFAVVKHSDFCGHDMGLTFYVHPDNAARLLPAPVELSDHEKVLLSATCQYKASYGGRDRYEMARPYGGDALAYYPTREQWEQAKQSLIQKGLLDKRGAVTVAGRNANAG